MGEQILPSQALPRRDRGEGAPQGHSPRGARRGRCSLHLCLECQILVAAVWGPRQRISPDLRLCPLTHHESLKAGLPRGQGTRVPFVRGAGAGLDPTLRRWARFYLRGEMGSGYWGAFSPCERLGQGCGEREFRPLPFRPCPGFRNKRSGIARNELSTKKRFFYSRKCTHAYCEMVKKKKNKPP